MKTMCGKFKVERREDDVGLALKEKEETARESKLVSIPVCPLSHTITLKYAEYIKRCRATVS